MATAILTVLYPDEFTVYDERVVGQLGNTWTLARELYSASTREAARSTRWDAYQRYVALVEDAAPAGLSLRDKDRYLWAKSLHEQLQDEIARGFV
jgi:hypothetical protein